MLPLNDTVPYRRPPALLRPLYGPGVLSELKPVRLSVKGAFIPVDMKLNSRSLSGLSRTVATGALPLGSHQLHVPRRPSINQHATRSHPNLSRSRTKAVRVKAVAEPAPKVASGGSGGGQVTFDNDEDSTYTVP